MKRILKYILIGIVIFSCKENGTNQSSNQNQSLDSADLIIAFGSCNRQTVENKLWAPILENNPSIWIWGGDVIYSDTDDMSLMAEHYEQQLAQKGYGDFKNKVQILGTWDDHDYGLNDGGVEFVAKAPSQQLFLDFLGVSATDERRNREGVYHSEIINSSKGSVNIIVLDTRYFRTALTPSSNSGLRYQPNDYGDVTILGDLQWNWLEDELNNSETDFNLIISSIQFLSNKHGFESWGNMPHEVDKLEALIKTSQAKGVIVLSGDRHISEFSKTTVKGLSYPLIDFTSSGMTHSYTSYDGEPNPFREGHVVSSISFGLVKFNFDTKTVVMQMRGENNALLQEIIQAY